MAHPSNSCKTFLRFAQVAPDRDSIPPASMPSRVATGPSWQRWLPILLVLAVVLLPLTIPEIPGEIARWYAALAQERLFDEDWDGVQTKLNQAFAWDSDSEQALLVRMRLHQERERFDDALADCDRLLKTHPQDLQLLQMHALLLQSLGRFSDAVADYVRVAELNFAHETNRPLPLNNLAYARALAKEDLDKGLDEIERALKVATDNAGYLDTRGFLHYQRGDFEAAIKDLDKSVDGVEADLKKLLENEDRERRKLPDGRLWKAYVKQEKRGVAVIRYHRSLVRKALGDTRGAAEDEQRVRDLGFEPNERLF